MDSVAAGHDGTRGQSRKAALSGWIGSTLEFYDFLIYAAASALVFPQLFFPSSNPAVAIIASLATYAVGYVVRPVGAFVLGHIGDTAGRKTVLLICLFMMGASTIGVGLLPTYEQVGVLAPVLLVLLRMCQGFAVSGELTGASCMVLEHAPFGQRGFLASFAMHGANAGQVLAAAVFLPLTLFLSPDDFLSWGWRVPFLLSVVVLVAGYVIRREVRETPVFVGEASTLPRAPVLEAFRNSWGDMVRVALMAAINVVSVVVTVFGTAYAVQPAYGIGLPKDLFLWITVASCFAGMVVIPFVARLSDRIGRRPPVILGAISSGLLSFVFLYAIEAHNATLTFISAVLMWGILYNGYGATFPAFFPELFAARYRVSAMAIGQNAGVAFTALLPGLLVAVAPPGSAYIPLTVGTITFGVTLAGAVAAWSAQETYRLRMADLGHKDAVPVVSPDHGRLSAHGA